MILNGKEYAGGSSLDSMIGDTDISEIGDGTLTGAVAQFDEDINGLDTGKADKVTSAVEGNFAGLDSNGNLTDSGHKHSDYLTQHQDISGKADKVTGATNGNLAKLDANGNLADAGWASDKTTTSATGNPISISGLKSNQLAIDPVITFEPIQAGSGTPSPSNIRAISGYDKVDVLSCGINIFNGQVIQGRWSTTDGTWIDTAATFWATQNPIPVIGGQSNYISNIVYRIYYDKNMTFISSDSTGSAVAITPTNAVWMHITQAKADWSSPSTTMVAISNTAIDYVPYHKATSITESLGQTVYHAIDNVREGKLNIDSDSYVFTGNETWASTLGGRAYSCPCLTSKPSISNAAQTNVYKCEIAEPKSANDLDASQTGIAANGTSIFISTDLYASISSFIGKKIVYKVATPTEIQLTPHEISLLKDYAYLSTNGTNITLDYHNGEIASLADVSQLGETVNLLGDTTVSEIGDYIDLIPYNATNNTYIPQRDGYIFINSSTASSGDIQVDVLSPTSVTRVAMMHYKIANTNERYSLYVRKGLRIYVRPGTPSGVSIVFTELLP